MHASVAHSDIAFVPSFLRSSLLQPAMAMLQRRASRTLGDLDVDDIITVDDAMGDIQEHVQDGGDAAAAAAALRRDASPRIAQLKPRLNKEQRLVRQMILGSFVILALLCGMSMMRGEKAISSQVMILILMMTLLLDVISPAGHSTALLVLQVAIARERTIENDEVALALHLHAQRQRSRQGAADGQEGRAGGGDDDDDDDGNGDDDPFGFDFSRFLQNYHLRKHRSCVGMRALRSVGFVQQPDDVCVCVCVCVCVYVRAGASSVVVASRYFGKSPSDFTRLEGFVKQTGQTCASALLIAVNIAEDRTRSYHRLLEISKLEGLEGRRWREFFNMYIYIYAYVCASLSLSHICEQRTTLSSFPCLSIHGAVSPMPSISWSTLRPSCARRISCSSLLKSSPTTSTWPRCCPDSSTVCSMTTTTTIIIIPIIPFPCVLSGSQMFSASGAPSRSTRSSSAKAASWTARTITACRHRPAPSGRWCSMRMPCRSRARTG